MNCIHGRERTVVGDADRSDTMRMVDCGRNAIAGCPGHNVPGVETVSRSGSVNDRCVDIRGYLECTLRSASKGQVWTVLHDNFADAQITVARGGFFDGPVAEQRLIVAERREG